MKHLSFSIFIIAVLSFTGCENSTEPTYKLVEGIWTGTIDEITLDITFIEGEFEGNPTVTGSAHIITENETSKYLIMNGTNDGKSNVVFALYEVPIAGKEDYHMKGTVNDASISGSFEKLNKDRDIIASGSWQVQRIP